MDIKYLPKYNAVQELYAAKTGYPFMGVVGVASIGTDIDNIGTDTIGTDTIGTETETIGTIGTDAEGGE